MLQWKLSVLEIPLDKELTANFLINPYEIRGADPGCMVLMWAD